jgi:Cu2+-exporting ATPase/Cu+-exporting ATPase
MDIEMATASTPVSRGPVGCIHCGNPVTGSAIPRFCCRGCETVYAWIHDQGFAEYYRIQKGAAPGPRPDSEVGPADDFAYLDEPEFREAYSWPVTEGRSLDFYVEGVHCAACVWLVERIPSVAADVTGIRLNLATSVARVTVGPRGSFAEVARALSSAGYRPSAVRLGGDAGLRLREDRALLVRLGVAAACAGNIMLLAVASYAGVRGALASELRWLGGALFLPVALYCAVPFYRTAWAALRARRLSIDLPIAFGILAGSLVSFINLASGHEELYFDSISSLVFLLLSTRVLLRRVQRTALDSSHAVHFLASAFALRWDVRAGRFERVSVDRLAAGDRIRVGLAERVPADGVVVSGRGAIDGSLLTGESRPESVGPGSVVHAGTICVGPAIELEVRESGARTRLGLLMSSMEASLQKKAPIVQLTDRVSRYFVAAVVTLSVFAFGRAALAGGVGWHEGLSRALAISIVTCPCTFALATPLVFSLVLGRLARLGVLVRSPDALERLSGITEAYIDKTGTLTSGELSVTSWDFHSRALPERGTAAAIVAIESASPHPMARAIVRHLEEKPLPPLPAVSEWAEHPGSGIAACCAGRRYRLLRGRGFGQASEVDVWVDGERVGTFRLQDRLRASSLPALDRLRFMGVSPFMLTGDACSAAREVALELRLTAGEWFAEASPEEKGERLAGSPRAAMVGDGANDAVALAEAHVGIAVRGGVEISLRAADVYLARGGVGQLPGLIGVARETLTVIRRNLAFSVIYNLIAATLAWRGQITPLQAAVLMPASALTVFMSSIWGTSRMREAFAELSR